MIPYPDTSTLSEFQKSYISLIPPSMHLLEAMDFSHQQLLNRLQSITEERSVFSYQAGKWTIKEMVLHIIDADRVFQYRALSIARGVIENLPSFDENEFARNSNANQVPFHDLVEEYILVSTGFKMLFQNLRERSYLNIGMANHVQLSASTIGYMAAGHRLHHLKILQERYLV
jgi:hypothetical protein